MGAKGTVGFLPHRNHTAGFTGRVWVVPAMGTVCHGAGTVRENPTRGLPVLNPTQALGSFKEAVEIFRTLSTP